MRELSGNVQNFSLHQVTSKDELKIGEQVNLTTKLHDFYWMLLLKPKSG